MAKKIFFDNRACVLPLEEGEKYYFNDCGYVQTSKWKNKRVHFYRLQSQNVFLDKETAEHAKDVRDTHNRILAVVKKIDAENGWVTDWDNTDQEKFIVLWSYSYDSKDSSSTYYYQSGEIYMSEQAKDYLMSDKVSDEDFKKFCLIYK